jgi:capsular polysaccharide biosynthesis protein
VALGAVFGLALAAVYLLVVPKTYVATASVFVNPIGGSGDNAVDGARVNSLINLDTEAQLVTSQAVSAEAKVLLQTPEIVGQLVQDVSVAVPPNTNVLRISFTGSTPEEARAGASAYARGYLTNRLNRADNILEQQARALNQQINKYTAQLQGASPEEAAGLQFTLQSLQESLALVEGTDVDPGDVISEALLPRRPASPNSALVLTSGLAFGILIGLAGLFLLERRDGRCYDWQTVERRLGLSVLANIPGKDAAPAPLFDAHSAGAEAFGELRNALLTGLGDEPAVLVVASPSEGFGADVVAANLAVTLARTGHATSLVIADEASEIPVMFGLPASDGLTELLRGRVDLAQATHTLPDLRALTVLAAGHGLSTEIDDLEGSGITDVIESLAEQSRYVIVRARPNDAGADAQFFGRHASAALPVIEVGRTVRDAVSAGVRQWQLVGTLVPGAVTVPAFDAPEPAPPRAVASTTGVDPDGGPAPRPALDKDTPDNPRKDQGVDQDPKGPDDDPPSAGPLRKAPPNR